MMTSMVALTKLIATLLGIGFVWCWLLPWLSIHPANIERLEFLERRGIDASAKFYTDLEAMEPILRRIENR